MFFLFSGFGLNRPAQITLHKVWPVDKTTHELIKDPQRLLKMNYSEKIESATIKFGGIFKEYRPDTGSWVFKVKHFSKYGLVDDEDDENMQTDNLQQSKNVQENLQTDPKQFVSSFTSKRATDIIFNLDDDDDETTDIFDEDEEEESTKNYYYKEDPKTYMLRNVLFDNDDKATTQSQHFEYEKSPKKSKLLLKNELITDHDEYFEKQAISFSFVQPQYTQKLDLILKPDDYPARNKIYYDISSIKCAPVPKIRFTNGSNNLIVIDGRNVNVCKLQLIPDLNSSPNLNDRFNLQMVSNSEICAPLPGKSPYIQVKQTVENKYNIERLEKLVKALYGNLDERNTDHEYYQERINRIIDWLTEQNRRSGRPTNLYDRIIFYLASNEIKYAVDDLIGANHPKLAILLSSGNNFSIKNNVCQQLLEWKEMQADSFISEDLLKIYVLLSGETKYRLSNNHQIDVLDNLTWTQQLSLLLLYSVDCDLMSCIRNMTCETNDVEYHLIANNDPLIAMSSAENDLEAWFLQQSLKSYGIIKSETNSNILHGLLSSELMTQNVRWACFVACHITHDLLREYTLKELLFNFVEKLTEEDENWLKHKLNLSPKYISSVKAVYAKSKFNYASLGTELLECEEWIEAHEILVEYIFPELVINEEHSKLRELIDKLKPFSEIIPNWYISGGHLYDIYCQCVSPEFGQLDQELFNQPFNFSLMKCSNNRQRLCQSEMSRKINLIYHEFNKERFLINTPVPSDYALKELKFNTRSILKELCS